MAARKITLQFGLVTVAANMETAVDKPVSMSNLCVGQPGHAEHDPVPLKMPKTCAECGEVTDIHALVKGVKSGQTYTLVNPDDLVDAKAKFTAQYKGAINVVPHPADEFMALTGQGESLHYLTPADAGGAGHYQLLVRLVEQHPELAFAGLFTPMSATSLYVLRVRQGVLMLEQRTREQAMRPVPSVGGDVNDALYAMLESVLPSLITQYDAAAYEDTYRLAVDTMLASGQQVAVAADAPAAPVAPSDADLMAKLQALVTA